MAQKRKLKLAQEALAIEKGLFIHYKDNNEEDPEKKPKQRTPRILDINFLEKIKWVNFRTQASFDLPCCLCGCFPAELHHIRHVRKGRFSEIDKEDTVKRMQALQNRRQVPLCKNCHLNVVHVGNYRGFPLGKLYNNQIVNSENYITISKEPFKNPPLEQKLLDSGWKKT